MKNLIILVIIAAVAAVLGLAMRSGQQERTGRLVPVSPAPAPAPAATK